MKKRKMKISQFLIKSDEKISAEVESRMAMNELERYSDPRSARLVPCAICHADGDEIRKPFVPVDAALKLMENGIGKRTSISISICARCIAKLLNDNMVYQVLNNKDLRRLLK